MYKVDELVSHRLFELEELTKEQSTELRKEIVETKLSIDEEIILKF